MWRRRGFKRWDSGKVNTPLEVLPARGLMKTSRSELVLISIGYYKNSKAGLPLLSDFVLRHVIFLPCAITNAMPHAPCQSQTKRDAQTWTCKLKILFSSSVYFGIVHSGNNKQWCCGEKYPGDPGGTSSLTNAGCSLQSHGRHSESCRETLGIASF